MLVMRHPGSMSSSESRNAVPTERTLAASDSVLMYSGEESKEKLRIKRVGGKEIRFLPSAHDITIAVTTVYVASRRKNLKWLLVLELVGAIPTIQKGLYTSQ